MRKLSKLLIAVVLALTFALGGVLVACNDDPNDPTTAKITDGRWVTAENDPASNGAVLKLKEDNTFYYYSAWTYHIGTWKINEGDYTYYKLEQGQTPEEPDDDQTAYKSTQQLELTAHDGDTFTGVIAEGRIWNMGRQTLSGVSYDSLAQEKDYAWNEDEDEEPIYILSLFNAKNELQSVQLAASMTDTGTMYDGIAATPVEGTYKVTDAGYDLYNGETRYATITENEGEYVYTILADNSTVTLAETVWTPVATLTDEDLDVTLKGDTSVTSVYATLALWQDGTFSISLENNETYLVIGTVLEGTFASAANGGFTLTFGETTATSTEPDGSSNTSVTLTLPAGDVLENAVQVTLSGEYSNAAEVLHSFTAQNVDVTGVTGMEGAIQGSLSLDLYSDGTAQLVLTMSMGVTATAVVDTGTYTFEVSASNPLPAVTVNFEKAGVITAAPDYATATPTGVALDIAYTAENSAVSVDTGSGTPLPMNLSFTATMRYNYSTVPADKVVYTAEVKGAVVTAASPLPTQDGNTVDVTIELYESGEVLVSMILHTAGSGDFTIETADTGTWTKADGQIPTFTLTLQKAGTITSEPDYASAVPTGIDLKFNYTASNVSFDTSMGIPVSLTFTASTVMHYSIG